MAASAAVQGKAVAVEGGYRVSGRFAWASGIHHATWVVAGCFVFDGDTQRLDQTGMPIVRHAVVPKSDVTMLDTWHVVGMRGTGSTEFELRDLFVPEEYAVIIFSEPRHPAPFFRLPTSFFGFASSGVALGIARSSVTALKDLAARKKSPPPRLGLGDKANTHYVVAKAEAMVEAGRAGVREAFTLMWHHIVENGVAPMESRARLRRAIVHAVESSVAAVDLCFHTAGGTALFENEPFERALRDVHAVSGHLVLQREMMEDAGRVALGMKPMLGLF